MQPFPLQQPQLYTERLILRPFKSQDAHELEVIANDFAVADTTMALEYPFTRKSAEEWLEPHLECYLNQLRITWAITLRESSKLIGMICLMFENDEANDCGELGFWLGSAYWNHGYATEAGSKVIAFAFDCLEVNRLEAFHCTRNPRSGNVLKKLGFSWLRQEKDALIKWDKSESIEIYSRLS